MNLFTLSAKNAFCFDVDSTVSAHEGIDELARWCGVPEGRVSKSTQQAMSDKRVSFRESLRDRLNVIRPSQQDVVSFVENNPPVYTHGLKDLVRLLHQHDIDVILVSGGFRPLIEPIARDLSVSHVFANTLLFHEDGTYMGFDTNELTSRDSGGKAEVVAHLKNDLGYDTVVMVGDGVTDLQTQGVADLFIGYGGVHTREAVKENADWFVTDFDDIRKLFVY